VEFFSFFIIIIFNATQESATAGILLFVVCVACVCELVGTGAKSQSSASLFSFVLFFLNRERETPRALKINNSGSPLLTNAPAAHGVHTAEPDSTPECSSTRWFKKLVEGKIGRVQNLTQLRIDIIFAFHQVDL
jgi:hypothetical protein